MFTMGFKYWFGAAVFALTAAFAYAVTTSDAGFMDTLVGPLSLGYKGAVGEHSGYTVLVGFAGVSIAVALLLSAWRDADPKSVAEVAQSESVPQPLAPHGQSYWPALGAFAGAMLAMGVVVDPAFTVIGLALVLVVGMEWTITAWADHATVDRSTNRQLRSKLFFPVELPVIGLLAIGVFVIAGSRILLAVSTTGSVVVAGVLATMIFVSAIAIAARPQLSRGLLNVLLVVGALGLLAGGVIAAAAGERDFHHGPEEQEPGATEEHEPAPTESHDEGADETHDEGAALAVLP